METMVYRKRPEAPLLASNGVSSVDISGGGARLAEATGESTELHPDIFYPLVSEKEAAIWSHWLPTTLTYNLYNQTSYQLPSDVFHMLTKLNAPQEVVEEFRWARKMELFDTYEIKTPERQDLKDPLLLGLRGGKRYRMALWGESLRPFEEITAIVEKSLALRRRAASWNKWFLACGTVLGLGIGLWSGSQMPVEEDPVRTSVLFALFGLSLSWFCTWIYTPENRQQAFLDRYRR